MTELPTDIPDSQAPNRWRIILRNTAFILAALLIFLFTLDLMIASLQHLGKDAADIILLATSNPFTGLFIGLLVTALMQSSSATTAMTVALVASGSITLPGAVPIIMGANVGTTITSTIVSLGFITKKKEFRRAVTIGTYHDFFNILTVILLFPLEYYGGFLSGFSQYLATLLFNEPLSRIQNNFSLLGPGFSPIIDFIVSFINNGFILSLLSIGLLFGSILFFRKVLSQTLGFGSQSRFQQFFFKNGLKSFAWGLLTTAAIRSSTVTTSLVVPLVAKKVVRLKSAQPFILGANIGTTITAFIAALFNSNAAISIAIAHFLFNAIGVLIFSLIPLVNELPIKMADKLGRLTLKYRLVGFLYLLLTFFFIPFSLIYFNKDSVQVKELTYHFQNVSKKEKSTYKIITKTYINQSISHWMVYDSSTVNLTNPVKIFSVYRRQNMLMVNNELFELNKPGFCRDGEDEKGKYQTCIVEILPNLVLTQALTADSVYVYLKKWYEPRGDSTIARTYISATLNLLVRKETLNNQGAVLTRDDLVEIKKK
ncbi:MAG: Na/Pi cotransporter family protein [Cyclobacteriaceae bacterium]|nr:Na/Pi cotransporter family protein [Cyclobacteriaceae bacterium]